MLIVSAVMLVSCESPQRRAMRELSEAGVEASGYSLVRAVTDRDPVLLALLLEAGVYTEQRDARGRTPLGISIQHGDVSTALALLAAGAKVNASQAGHACILGMAVKRGHPQMVELLLARGAKTDGLMPGGEKVLPWAIREGRLGMVRAMMKSGADPHLRDRLGNPLLHVAMHAGRRDLVEMLIGLGADPGAPGVGGESTVHLALRHGWIDIIPDLAAAGADTNAVGPGGRTLLEQAVVDGDMDRIRLLLRCGADPNRRHDKGGPAGPLQRVFASRNLEKARLLLAHGVCPPKAGSGGLSPVEASVLAGDTDFVKLLLDYGFAPGRALYFASADGARDMVSVLLACGASPDFTWIPSRDTPLIAAIRGGHDRVADVLLRYGANADHQPPEGQSLFHLAVVTGCPLTVKLLLAKGADPNAPFTRPVSPEFLQRVRPGIGRWVLKNDRKVTPLMLAADSGNIAVARRLIDSGAKSGVYTRGGRLWPINFASRRNDVAMMRLFLGRDPYREERVIEIRLSEQQARMYDVAGRELFSTRVSTGRKGYATPTGEYVITNKHRHWTSTLYHANMPYFQRFSCGDFGMHQGYVPNRPASHGCIRVPAGKAAKLFSMTETGDRVRIVP